MMMNGGNTTLVQPIRVRIPRIFSSPSPIPRMNPDFCCNRVSSAQLMVQNHSNFKRSGSPLRIMFYSGGSWNDFSSEVVEFLRSGFIEKKPVIEMMINGTNYVFDFLRMLQTDLVSWNHRSIAWIDENDNCFFPKTFLEEELEEEEELEDSQSIGIDVDIQVTIGKRRRESSDMGERDVEVTSLINGGDRREHGVDDTKRQRFASQVPEVSKWPNAKLMTEKANPSYLAVSNKFLSAITKVDGGATITAIHECTHSGPVEKARFEIFQRHIEITKAIRGSSNTVYAWFAASAETVTGILTHGFGLPCIISGSPAYGIGIYFSPVGLPQLSGTKSEVDNNGEKHIILCRVILGNVEKVEAGSQQRGPSSPDFDTGADDPENPKWYVVWDTKICTHILPEYVVTYKPSAQVTGEVGATSTRFSLPKIISKMEPRLSSSQLQQVLTAHDDFKARKMSKEKFIQQLRAFAGDQVIMSVIREIQCSG